MKLEGIDIEATLEEVESILVTEKELSPTLVSVIKVLILVVKLLTNRIGLDSRNSSKSSSSDPNCLKPAGKRTGKKLGGRQGHRGTTLKQIDDLDEVKPIKVDGRTLPKGHGYKEVGIEKRQVFDIDISRVVTEYQAQIL